jgi:anthranilate 1,2-dioxygenase small subunit
MAISDLVRDNIHVPAEVTALMAEYAHVIDGGRYEEWPALFTDPCLYRITTRENEDRGLPLSIILCDSQGMLLDRVVSVRTANVFIPHSYRHMVSCIQLMESATDEWRMRSNYLVIRTMPDGSLCVFSTGEYRDHVVMEAGEPKFRERVVICDHSMINNLIALPL